MTYDIEYELPHRSAKPIKTETITLVIKEIIEAPDIRRKKRGEK